MVDAVEYIDESQDKTFIEEPAILDKFKAAAAVTDAALAKAVELAIPGADIYTICQTVDEMIEAELKKTFASKKSKNIERGISFPTCISVNQIMGHFSPLGDESVQLKEGDIAKIMCGAHMDGYAANAATTVGVGEGKIRGRQADAVRCAYDCFQAAQRLIGEAKTNTAITAMIADICDEYKCKPVDGVLSHKVKHHLIDGNDVILNRETPGQAVDEFEFAPGDVIGLDIYVSTGEGKPKEDEARCTVYKRELDQVYSLKSKSSRAFMVEVNKRFPTLPFSIRAMTEQTAAKVGVRECLNHDMLVPYPVLTEKPGEFVAQFKGTVVVQPRSTAVLCGGAALDTAKYQSQNDLKSEDIKAVLAQDLWKKEKKSKAKK